MAKKKTETTDVAVAPETMPDFLKDMKGRGSEQVDHNDLIIPRIEVAQSLSRVRKKNSSAYIEGIEEGMLYNSVTRELYGHDILVVPVYFMKEHLLWRDQKLGGGFGGAFKDPKEAEDAVVAFDAPDEWESVLTHQHFCLIVKPDGTTEEVVVSMAKSKLKVSRKFNSLVRINGGDRFSRIYRIVGVADENQQGQEFYNLDVRNFGFVTEPIYRHGEKVYELIKSGAASADRSFDDEMPEDEQAY